MINRIKCALGFHVWLFYSEKGTSGECRWCGKPIRSCDRSMIESECKFRDMCFSYNIHRLRPKLKHLCETDHNVTCAHHLHYQNKTKYVLDVRKYLKVRGCKPSIIEGKKE